MSEAYASPRVRLKLTESEIQLIITTKQELPLQKSISWDAITKGRKQHSRAKKNKRKFAEKTVTLPSNQNKQRHQSSQRKSRINESHQISSKFLPQLRFVSVFDSSSRLLSRLLQRLWGSRWWSTLNRRKCFAAWNWNPVYLVQQPTR